ncbi:MAG: hypothetical protein OXE85_02540, partial [Roseovarius sp.]|nr:hypothetical protein [Roseovarius sp.]
PLESIQGFSFPRREGRGLILALDDPNSVGSHKIPEGMAIRLGEEYEAPCGMSVSFGQYDC